MGKLADFVSCAVELGSGPTDKVMILWQKTKNLRVRFGLGSYRPDRTYAVDTVYGTLHFRDNFGDITNLSTVIHKQPYRPRRPLEDGVILDIGSNIGMAAAYFAHIAPDRPLHCFEPLVQNTQLVTQNCPYAIVNQVAVGSEPGTIRLNVDDDSVMASSIATRWETQPREVDVIRLDDYVEQNGIDHIALIKVDTEGMELDVLDGARNTLAHTDQVILETHGRDRHEATLKRLRDAHLTILEQSYEVDTGIIAAVRSAVTVAASSNPVK